MLQGSVYVMGRRGDNSLAANKDVDKLRSLIYIGFRDSSKRLFAGLFIPCPDIVADHNVSMAFRPSFSRTTVPAAKQSLPDAEPMVMTIVPISATFEKNSFCASYSMLLSLLRRKIRVVLVDTLPVVMQCIFLHHTLSGSVGRNRSRSLCGKCNFF